jgi:Bifunctional DNA primase/polymerase, N-terminal
VPAKRCAILHLWALVENREFSHEFAGALLCREGSEKAVRLAVGRELDALSLFLKTSDYEFGTIKRGGGKNKAITFYGSFAPNRTVAWIQDQLATDPDKANPIVAVDRYVAGAITRHIPKVQKELRRKERSGTAKRRRGLPRQELSLTSVRLLNLPNCTFESAVILARFGFPIFPAWCIADRVCRCPRGIECMNQGKHPIMKGWRQTATTYEPSLVKFWDRHPFANIGIATGRRWANDEFLSVIDCDHRHFGHGSISNLERNELCPLPPTREHSRGGGPHKFYTYPEGFHSQNGV